MPNQIVNSVSKYWKEIIAILLLFIFALGLRITYQQEAIVRNHIISDAKEYFLGAYNLRFFGVYSTLATESGNSKPKPNAVRTPGYSLFLTPFIYTSQDIPQFLNRVMTAQAVMGSITAVLAFTLMRLSLGFTWAFLVGLLTAFSPHLIAMDDYLLTESLFTFVTLTATVLLVFSWRSRQLIWVLLSGGFFGLSILVKPSALLLGLFMSLVYFFDYKKWTFAPVKLWTKCICCFVIGMFITFGPYLIRNTITLGEPFPESNRGWQSFVQGTYINMTYKDPRFYGYPYRDDPEYNKIANNRKYFV
jgi:hypothetical protein